MAQGSSPPAAQDIYFSFVVGRASATTAGVVLVTFVNGLSDDSMEPTPRRAARLLVVDKNSGAVLLFQYEDGGRTWWATPGGALDGDETFEQAAIREAAEELAVSSPTFLPLWHRTVEFSFRGTALRQQERYFLLRIARGDVALGHEVREAHRHEGIVAARWWSLEDIETTSEQVFPEDLAQRLRERRFEAASTERP